ncbi:MAG: hypothetical protein JO105_22875 [Hyphomicrobiales bacterium]|nr:hypothetical protein [Hyphomicrobiales bacterium]
MLAAVAEVPEEEKVGLALVRLAALAALAALRQILTVEQVALIFLVLRSVPGGVGVDSTEPTR